METSYKKFKLDSSMFSTFWKIFLDVDDLTVIFGFHLTEVKFFLIIIKYKQVIKMYYY